MISKRRALTTASGAHISGFSPPTWFSEASQRLALWLGVARDKFRAAAAIEAFNVARVFRPEAFRGFRWPAVGTSSPLKRRATFEKVAWAGETKIGCRAQHAVPLRRQIPNPRQTGERIGML
jgi:hypothetical protein